MKVINFAMLLIFLFSLVPVYAVYAQEEITGGTDDAVEEEVVSTLEETENVRTTPDKAGYGLKVAFEKIGLALTFNKARKAERALELAERRIREAKLMAVQGKLEALQRAKEERKKLLEIASNNAEAIEDDEQALEVQTEFEAEVESQESQLEEVESLFLVKARGLTEEQKAKLLALIEEFKQQNSEVKVKIVVKKDIIKTRLKARGVNEREIEEKIKAKEEKIEANLERNAQHQIAQSKKMFELVSNLIIKAETEKNVTISQETLDLKAKAETKLNEANIALTNKEFLKTIELARESKKLSALTIASIRGAPKLELEERLKILEEKKELREKIREEKEEFREKLKERIKEEQEDLEEDEEELEEEIENEEAELEIEAEIGYYSTKIEVEINGVEEDFTLDTTNRGEVIAKIAEKYGLTVEEVQEAIEFK